ncbi:MAG: hypothetical protein FJ096_11835 [Deltaproteobacteria bacterium]|nr:hypothetical protein [Deltaproteobacteria bacterium]
MKRLLSLAGFFAVLVVFATRTPTAEARNPAGNTNSPACKACVNRLKSEEACVARDIRDPRWHQGCARAVVRSLTECKTECL